MVRGWFCLGTSKKKHKVHAATIPANRTIAGCNPIPRMMRGESHKEEDEPTQIPIEHRLLMRGASAMGKRSATILGTQTNTSGTEAEMPAWPASKIQKL